MTPLMNRRAFIGTLSGGLLAAPLAVEAQQKGALRLIGVLVGYAESDPAAKTLLAVFRSALAKLGWTEGSNVRIELRWGAGNSERIKTFAKDLVNLRPGAILGHSTPVVAALARETRTIPIVFAGVADPVGSHFAANLAHPGGNITGFTPFDSTLGGKLVELLKEIAPRITRVVLLFNPATAGPLHFFMPSIQAAASSVAVTVKATPVHARDEIEGVIAAQARNPEGGVIVMPDAFNSTNRVPIIALAARYAVPAIYFNATHFAESGGLISYGPDFAEMFRLAAGYIDRVLKDANPGELPIQQPTKFELVINLKTAKALGLTIPPSLLQRADQVIDP